MEVLRTAILDKLRRNNGESISTSEIVKQMYPEDWELFLDDVNLVAIEMCREGMLNIISANQSIGLDSSNLKALQLTIVKNLK